MHAEWFIAIGAGLILVGLVRRRLESLSLSAPLALIALGLAGSFVLKPEAADSLHSIVLAGELALALLLFVDAARTSARHEAVQLQLPIRLLAVGLPLSWLFGLWIAQLLWPDTGVIFWLAASALFAPTDAALGQLVVSSERVPDPIRDGLIFESGLNDGLVLPLILFAAASLGLQSSVPDLWLMIESIMGAVVLGVTSGCLAGVLYRFAQRQAWASETDDGVSILATTLTVFFLAEYLHVNGLIAVFVAGLAFGVLVKSRCAYLFEFIEGDGQFLSWTVFILLGFLFLPEALMIIDWRGWLFIALSLAVVRPLAVWIALYATRFTWSEKLFVGWFGPRGLATFLFSVILFEQAPTDAVRELLSVAVVGVAISAFLHGVTTQFAVNRLFGARSP